MLFVFGLTGALVAAGRATDPTAVPIPTAWLIHARTPVELFSLLAAGLAMGIASTWAKPRWFKFPILALEATAAGLLSFYFLSMSFLPEPRLQVAVGESFPAYELLDQDRQLRRYPLPDSARTDGVYARNRALYIFYRGDW